MAIEYFDNEIDDSISVMSTAHYPKSNWEKWFAWYPIKIKGKRVWLEHVYRRYDIWRDESELYGVEYGTIFDVLKKE